MPATRVEGDVEDPDVSDPVTVGSGVGKGRGHRPVGHHDIGQPPAAPTGLGGGARGGHRQEQRDQEQDRGQQGTSAAHG